MSRPGTPRPVAMTVLLAASLAGAIGCGGSDAPRDTATDTTATDTTTDDTATDDTGTEASPADTAGTDAALLPAWSESAWAGGSGTRSSTQSGFRTAPHEGYDRVVLEFAGAVPRYDVRYADGTPRQCGSGRPVALSAPGYVRITLEPARAHDDRGGATVTDRTVRPGLPVVRAATLLCDFEGRVEWVLAVERRTAIRVVERASPARLVVDLRH